LFNYLEKIGAGGLGEVHKIVITDTNASSKPVGSEWALKKLNDQWRAHPVMMRRFEREIATLKEMTHNNIVPFEGENLAEGDERFYLMPLFNDNVRQFVARGGKRGDWRFMAGLGVTLANAMHYAHTHTRQFVHRDLKPENILFNGGKQLVIADWGLGYFVHKQSVVLVNLTRGGGLGTEYYCSFEQWTTGKCDARGDIYALAMTLDEMVTGNQRQIQVGLGIKSDCTPPTSQGSIKFNRLLRDMSGFFPHERPASMAEVARRLQEAINAG